MTQEQKFLPDEDQELRQLIETEGPGNWADKAQRFSTAKSAAALRMRWETVLSANDEERMNGAHL